MLYIPTAIAVGICIYLVSIKYHYDADFYDTRSLSIIRNKKVSINSKIQGNNCELELDTGSSENFAFLPKFLETLVKVKKGDTQSFDMHGNIHTTPEYLLDEVVIGKLIYYDLIVKEESIDFSTKKGFFKQKETPD